MIKYILVFFASWFGVATNALSQDVLAVGRLENGQPVFTKDKAPLFTNLTRNLAKAGINGTFNEVSIKEVKGTYYLIFTGNMKAAFSIVAKGAELFAETNITCTTTECASDPEGCLPVVTYCTECTNKGKCAKTVSNESLLN